MTPEALDLHEDLLLHEIEAHGQQRHADQQVNGADDQLAINSVATIVGALVQRLTRDEITEADR